MTTPGQDIRRIWDKDRGRFVFTVSVMALMLLGAIAVIAAAAVGVVWWLVGLAW